MSCSCCPPIIFANGGSTPPGESACISADEGNALTEGADGCLSVPTDPNGPVRPGPDGLTICLSEEAGQTAVFDPVGCLLVPEPVPLAADPAECNAAEITDGVLLVPRTKLTAATGAAPAAQGTDRSVDIDVVETPGCPQTWTVGARLTPPSGFKTVERGHADLLAVAGEDVPIPESDIVLPEVGTYHIDADVRYLIGTDTGGSGYIIGWLSDELNNLLVSFTQIAVVNSPNAQDYDGGTCHIMSEFVIGTAPRTVTLHLMFVPTGGTITGAAAGGSDSNGATRMRYLKCRD